MLTIHSTQQNSITHGHISIWRETMKSCIVYATTGAIVGTIGTLILSYTIYTGLLLIIIGMYLFLVGGPISYFKVRRH